MAVARLSTSKVNLDYEPQGLYLRPHKGTFQINSVLLFQHCPTSLARRVLPDQDLPDKDPIGKQKPDSSPQLAPTSRGAVCSLARKTSPTEICATNSIYEMVNESQPITKMTKHIFIIGLGLKYNENQ
ncbi:hypothetical protein TB2_031193 [Malus domestica]